MKTDYGKIAYQKTEDILKQIKVVEDEIKCVTKVFRNQTIDFSNNFFEHSIKAKSGTIIQLNMCFEYAQELTIDVEYCLVINNTEVFIGKLQNLSFPFVSSGQDSVCLKFTTSSTLQDDTVYPIINYINFNYCGVLKDDINYEPLYFDDNMTYYVVYFNDVYTRYTSLNKLFDEYKFENPVNNLYSFNSTINGTRKAAMYGLFYNEETSKLTLKYLISGGKFALKNVKPDHAIFTPVSSSQIRVFYLLNNEIYYFTTSLTGTNISSETKVQVPINSKIKRLFPIKLVNGNTSNFYSFGVICEDGAYVIRYNSTNKTFDSKKYIGKCDYASGYYTNSSVSIVLYKNGVATIKTFSDRLLTCVTNVSNYYNYLAIYNVSGTLLGLNYNGLSVITT